MDQASPFLASCALNAVDYIYSPLAFFFLTFSGVVLALFISIGGHDALGLCRSTIVAAIIVTIYSFSVLCNGISFASACIAISPYLIAVLAFILYGLL